MDNVPSVPATEFAERRTRAAAAAGERGLSGLIVWSLGGTSVDWYGDVFYLSNHHPQMPAIPETIKWSAAGYSAVVLPVDGEPVLITTALDDADARVCIDDARHATHLPQAVADVVREKEIDVARLGLVGRQTMLLQSYRQLTDALGGDAPQLWADDILASMRSIKSANELGLVRRAAEVGVQWMKTTMEAIEPGRTEADAVADGIRFLVTNGGYPYDVAIASGPKSLHYWGSSGIPHWDNRRPLEKGDLVHCDTWGPVNGYFTDFCRSTVVGRSASPSQRELLEGAADLIESIVSEVRPGVTFGDLYRRGSDWLIDNGFATHVSGEDEAGHKFGEMFPAFGHCIGLGIENPHIIEGEPTELAANMVLGIEAVVGRPGVGAAGFEHNVIVTADGPDVLTATCPTVWWD